MTEHFIQRGDHMALFFIALCAVRVLILGWAFITEEGA